MAKETQNNATARKRFCAKLQRRFPLRHLLSPAKCGNDRLAIRIREHPVAAGCFPHRGRSFEYVASSIKEFGWKQPIVIDRDGAIIAGHTRYKAAKMLGLDTAPCLIADDLTPEQVRAYRIADNKVSDFSVWDNKLLLEELEEISADIFTGFDISDLFDDTLNEACRAVIEDNAAGVIDKLSGNDTAVYR